LVKVGVIAIDGTKISANAGRDANKSYRRIVHEILEEAEETDRAEDEQHGDRRGDELTEEMHTEEGRRAAFRAAKQRLVRHSDGDRDRESKHGRDEGSDPADGVAPPKPPLLEFDAEAIVARANGRDGWLQDARRQLTARRERNARAVAWSRSGRLLESARRQEEHHAGEIEANRAYEHYRATGRDKQGRRLSRPSEPVSTTGAAGGAYQHDRPGLADHEAGRAAGEAGLQRAGRGEREPDHHRRGDRGQLTRFREP